jgi:[acyl-carrier-protein] S-malonyltransferase
MKKIASEIPAFSDDKGKDVKLVMDKLISQSPAIVDKASKLKLISRCLAIVVCTQNRNWDNDEYQKGVVEPYRRVQQMLEELEKTNQEPTPDQMNTALEMLRLVFATKRTPVAEQAERFTQVFDETGTRSLFPNFTIPA